MTDSHGEIDIAGIGKVAQAIPENGWKKAIDTACDTFSELIAPIAKTTAGLGGLIQAKFDAMIDVQKVFAADAVRRARRKTQHVNVSSNIPPSARVLVSAIEEASVESDENLRDIWANLIANELAGRCVHPEFPRILARLSTQDAIVLSQVAERHSEASVRTYAKGLAKGFLSGTGLAAIYPMVVHGALEPSDAHHEHLERLALIKERDSLWTLTHFGEEFVAAVTDPSLTTDQASS